VVSVISQSPITISTRTRERLVYFVVSDDGVLIALYNDDDRAVIRMKDVTADHYTDWHLNVRPTVSLCRIDADSVETLTPVFFKILGPTHSFAPFRHCIILMNANICLK